jgi:hypothetical protein
MLTVESMYEGKGKIILYLINYGLHPEDVGVEIQVRLPNLST